MISFDRYFFLTEGARIQHAEDVIFWEGSRGALRALGSLMDLQRNYKNVTIKWDGSPAVIFGRNSDGEFVFTDKNGFTAKGYDGKAKSPDALREMFLNRSGGKNRENPDYVEFANRMARCFSLFEKAFPKSKKGYIKGDMLYFEPPQSYNGNYIFRPNIVEYAVAEKSDLGKRIGNSIAGVVIHREVDEAGEEFPLSDYDILEGEKVLVVPPVSVEEAPALNIDDIQKINSIITQFAHKIDNMLDDNKLRELKIADFPDILYNYTNSKVDTGLSTLGLDFIEWLNATTKVTQQKKTNIINYIQQHLDGFSALWQIVNGIMRIKDNIIDQFDKRSRVVKQSIDGVSGGEGYVLADTGGDIKLVPRETFSKANRAKVR